LTNAESMVDWSRSLDAAGCSRKFEISAKSPWQLKKTW
jgi:hypothetical protein